MINRDDYICYEEYENDLLMDLFKDVQLLPCPFCNGKAELEIKQSFYTVFVECTECHARSVACDSPFLYKNIYERKESAIKAWNRREK